MYGENARELRDALAMLLRHHRITQRLGGPGTWTVPESTTIADRRSLGEQIRVYRQGVLVWCLEALVAANPWLTLEGGGPRRRDPEVEFHRRLGHPSMRLRLGCLHSASSPFRRSSSSSICGVGRLALRRWVSTTSAQTSDSD